LATFVWRSQAIHGRMVLVPSQMSESSWRGSPPVAGVKAAALRSEKAMKFVVPTSLMKRSRFHWP
jgi:hypothetical protein